MAAAPRLPAAAHTRQGDPAIIIPPTATAVAMIPGYPAPTRGSGPSGPGRSTPGIIARVARAPAPRACARGPEGGPQAMSPAGAGPRGGARPGRGPGGRPARRPGGRPGWAGPADVVVVRVGVRPFVN